MNLKEYQKVRDLNPREIKQAIDDFKNATPMFIDLIYPMWCDSDKGDIYIVKSLHALKHNSKSQILSKQDKDFIHVYNDFMNGKIK